MIAGIVSLDRRDNTGLKRAMTSSEVPGGYKNRAFFFYEIPAAFPFKPLLTNACGLEQSPWLLMALVGRVCNEQSAAQAILQLHGQRTCSRTFTPGGPLYVNLHLPLVGKIRQKQMHGLVRVFSDAKNKKPNPKGVDNKMGLLYKGAQR